MAKKNIEEEDDEISAKPAKKGKDLDKDFGAEDGADENAAPKINRKKLLLILVPVLIVIGVAVSFFTIYNSKLKSNVDKNYSIVEKPGKDSGKTSSLIFYDLPEISVHITSAIGTPKTLKMRISLELSKVQDIPVIEGLTAQINDVIISHTIDLVAEELNDSEDFYWLKQELLYCINLVTDPIAVTSISFKGFEIETKK